MAGLSIQSGPEKGGEFSLTADVCTLGRNRENRIALSDQACSRYHAEIAPREGSYVIRDLNSTHGTSVNGARIAGEQTLHHNDLIQIGNTQILFTAPDAKPVAPPAAAPSMGDLDLIRPSSGPAAREMGGETIAFSLPSARETKETSLSESHLDRLARVAKSIESVIDLDDLLRRLMDEICETFRAERGVILLREGADGELIPKVRRPAEDEVRLSRTIMDHALENRVALLISDAQMDKRFSGAESVMLQQILSAICAPLVSKDKTLGLLYIDAKSHWMNYTKDDLALLNVIAAQAAIAIENAMLVREKIEAERLAAIGVAVAGIAHYVKNIIFGVTGSSSLIESSLEKDDFATVKKLWPLLQRSNTKIIQLVQDMLTYSKRREPQWEPGNVNSILRDVHATQFDRAEQSGVELALELDENLPDSEFEPKAIHDTILNIAGNAIEACARRDGARVVLRSSIGAAPETVHVRIADNGPGIPPDIQQKIFEPFFSTKGSKGTGLGLAVARKTIEEHRGRLDLRSAPDQGAIFDITLPLHAPKREESAGGDDETIGGLQEVPTRV